MVRLSLTTGSGGSKRLGDTLKYSPRRKPETNALDSQHEEERDDSTLLDEECADPFYHQFYDNDGRSMFEQLLRRRMRVLVLTKMVYGRTSLQYIRAEIKLAEAYARLNLRKQGHIHVLTANELLKTVDAKVDAQDAKMAISGHREDKSLILNVLEYSYDIQADDAKKSHVALQEVVDVIQSWKDSNNSKVERVMMPFDEKSLASVFGSTSTLHWQQLILQLERHSTLYQGYMARIESKVPVSALTILRNTFSSLDLSLDGVVPFHTLLLRLEHELRPRLELFMGRLFLRGGQLDDAARQVQLAIAEQEQLVGTESVTLVQYYLVIAEAMAVRFKQTCVVAQQSALESTDTWLQSTEGSRALRAKAIILIDEECARTNTMLTKKDAETRARELLVQEHTATTMDAFRHCLAVSPHWLQEEQKQVHLKIYQAAIDGFGECSMEASESAKELGNLLVGMGNLKGAEKYLKTACYIVESHFGPNDRRYRRLRKEVLDVSAQLESSTLEGGDHDDHAWLNI
ncbi:hypothetical protein FI667_g1376, partial [Globisporangium splendens]